MRYQLKNLGPGPFYSVEVAKLVREGDSVRVNHIDEGTRRLAEGPSPRFEISEEAPPRAASVVQTKQGGGDGAGTNAPAGAAAPTDAQLASAGGRAGAAEAASARGAALDVAPRARAAAKSAPAPAPASGSTAAGAEVIK